MARPKRLEYPGALWHLTNRGVEQRNIFLDEADRQVFLDLVSRTSRRYRWRVHQYCLMSNHFHLLSETLEPTLSRGMQNLTGKYADYFNARYKRSGHLYKGRFDAQLVEGETYLLTVARYIVLNPVRARMVESPADWKWSSYRATAGLERTPAWLHTRSVLDRFDEWDRPIAAALYRAFVAEAIGNADSPWAALRAGLYLGSEGFIERIKTMTRECEWKQEHLKRQQNVGAADINMVAAIVAQHFGVSIEEKRCSNELARFAFAILAHEEAIATLTALGSLLGLTSSGACRLLERAESLRKVSQPLRDALLALKLVITQATFNA